MTATSTDYERPGWVRPTSEGERFFYEHAGWGYHPATESPEEGRWRGARRLRDAELHAEREGWTVTWDVDPDITSADWTDEEPAWQTWVCDLFDQDGDFLSSLGGVDFGRDGTPWGDPYARVVAAELADEARS